MRANRALEQLPLWFNKHFRVVIMCTSQTRLLGSAALRLMFRRPNSLLTAAAAYLDPPGRIKYLKPRLLCFVCWPSNQSLATINKKERTHGCEWGRTHTDGTHSDGPEREIGEREADSDLQLLPRRGITGRPPALQPARTSQRRRFTAQNGEASCRRDAACVALDTAHCGLGRRADGDSGWLPASARPSYRRTQDARRTACTYRRRRGA